MFGLTLKPIAHQLEDIGLWNGNMAINTKQNTTKENKRGKYTKYKREKKRDNIKNKDELLRVKFL